MLGRNKFIATYYYCYYCEFLRNVVFFRNIKVAFICGICLLRNWVKQGSFRLRSKNIDAETPSSFSFLKKVGGEKLALRGHKFTLGA